MSMIGEMLVKNGMITEQELNEALHLQKEQKKRLGEILIELGYLKSKELIWMLSEQADIPFIELRPEMLDSALINSFPEKILLDNNILPLYQTEDKIYVALGDPTNTIAIQKIEEYTNKTVVVSGAEAAKIENLLNKFFLEQQVEDTIETEYKGKVNIKMLDNRAIVEFIDESGNVIKKVPAKVEIKISDLKGGINERDA